MYVKFVKFTGYSKKTIILILTNTSMTKDHLIDKLWKINQYTGNIHIKKANENDKSNIYKKVPST
jgi:hypothetical protein